MPGGFPFGIFLQCWKGSKLFSFWLGLSHKAGVVWPYVVLGDMFFFAVVAFWSSRQEVASFTAIFTKPPAGGRNDLRDRSPIHGFRVFQELYQAKPGMALPTALWIVLLTLLIIFPGHWVQRIKEKHLGKTQNVPLKPVADPGFLRWWPQRLINLTFDTARVWKELGPDQGSRLCVPLQASQWKLRFFLK